MKNSIFVVLLLMYLLCVRPVPAAESKEDVLVIDSISKLAEYAGKDNVAVKMKPGIYELKDTSTSENIILKKYKDGKPQVNYPVSAVLNFSGSNSRYMLDGVVINIDTKLHRAFGKNHLFEIFVSGNNTTIEGLAVRDIGNEIPTRGVIMMHVMGDDNTISKADLFICGSSPYGYGHLLGKGGDPLVPLYKHTSLLVTGKNNKLLGCKVVTHAFGHGIVMQGAVNTLIKDCYVEGEMRSTDEMLKETGGLAHGVDFQSDYPPGRIVPGQMKGLAEDGIRTYPDGDIFGRRTEKVTVINCTVKNMRSGFALGSELPPSTIIGSTAIGCQEKGFSISSGGVIKDCKGDAMYGPLLTFPGNDIKDCTIELELIDTDSDFPPNRLAEINGSGHQITIKNYQNKKRVRDLPIVFGESFWADVHQFRSPDTDPKEFAGADGVTLINQTGMPVVFGVLSSNCRVITDGKVLKDEGRNNIVNPENTNDNTNALSKNTIENRTIKTSFISNPAKVTVLLPGKIEKDKRYPVLYVLPVFARDNAAPLAELQKYDVANKYSIICIVPEFDITPWYADHPTDKNVRQESYIIKDLIPWVDSEYPTIAGKDGKYLVGFSKSGWGAFSLLLRYPDIFGKAGAWDAPLANDKSNKWKMADVFGTQENFENYRIISLLEKRAALLQQDEVRLFVTGHGVHGESTVEAHNKMIELNIPHYYDFGQEREHNWHSGWLAGLIGEMVGDRN